MTTARIAVFGYSDVGHACLKFLLDRGENVVALYTHADNPNEKIWFPSAAKLAQANKVPVILDADFKNAKDISKFKALSADLLFSFYYRNMIPASIFSAPRWGAYNMHGSFLPKFRGRAPVNWAVLSGATQSGATLHVMVEKPDAGDIVDQEAIPIGPDDTTAIVQARVTEAAVKVLARQINNLKANKAPRKPQNAAEATYFGRRTAEDGRIDWTWPAQKVHDLVRAVTKPYPGAFGKIEGEEKIIWRTRLTGKKVTSNPAGESRRDLRRLFVACGDGFEIEILEMENKPQS